MQLTKINSKRRSERFGEKAENSHATSGPSSFHGRGIFSGNFHGSCIYSCQIPQPVRSRSSIQSLCSNASSPALDTLQVASLRLSTQFSQSRHGLCVSVGWAACSTTLKICFSMLRYLLGRADFDNLQSMDPKSSPHNFTVTSTLTQTLSSVKRCTGLLFYAHNGAARYRRCRRHSVWFPSLTLGHRGLQDVASQSIWGI